MIASSLGIELAPGDEVQRGEFMQNGKCLALHIA